MTIATKICISRMEVPSLIYTHPKHKVKYFKNVIYKIFTLHIFNNFDHTSIFKKEIIPNTNKTNTISKKCDGVLLYYTLCTEIDGVDLVKMIYPSANMYARYHNSAQELFTTTYLLCLMAILSKIYILNIDIHLHTYIHQ